MKTKTRFGAWALFTVLLAAAFPARSAAVTLEQTLSYESPFFACRTANLHAGKDGMVYAVSPGPFKPGFVLRLASDGSKRGGAAVDASAAMATANKGGFICVLHQTWNSSFLAIYDRDFKRVVKMPLRGEGIDAGDSGDFYILQGREFVRLAPDGHVVARYSNPVAPDQHVTQQFRVNDKLKRFYVYSGGNSIECSDFAGNQILTVTVRVQEQRGKANWDVDDDGNLWILEAGKNGPWLRGVAIAEDDLAATPHLLSKETELRLTGLTSASGDKPAITELRACGSLLLLRQRNDREIWQVFDRKTGRREGVVLARGSHLTVTYPDEVWTAGQEIPFQIELDSGDLKLQPRWRVWARPFGTVDYRELMLGLGGKLHVPADAAGLYHIKVSTEIQPLQRGEAECSVNGLVEIRAPNTAGSANVLTPDNRIAYGRGEEIPFSVLVRTSASGSVPVTIRLLDGRTSLMEWTGSAVPGKESTYSVPAALTKALRPGLYTLAISARGLTEVPQSIVIGPGMEPTPFHTVMYGDYGHSYPSPDSFWNLPDRCFAKAEFLRRLGYNFTADRLGLLPNGAKSENPLEEIPFAVGKDQTAEMATTINRLTADPLSVAPEKARQAGAIYQSMANWSAFGIHETGILLNNDAGIPLGSGYDGRKPERLSSVISSVSTALDGYPSFRGWTWAANWWFHGAPAGKTKEERAAYNDALQQAKEAGSWSSLVQGVCDKRFTAAAESWDLLAKSLKPVDARLATAVSPPYRNPDCYPPVTFSTVEEVDLQGQWEQVPMPYNMAHSVDFYRRPGKRIWGHPEIGNDSGTGDLFGPGLLQMVMRGVNGTGAYYGWGYREPDPRSSQGGSNTVLRRLNELMLTYGPWWGAMAKQDPIAIVASGRMFKTDSYVRITGKHFGRVFEAYWSCLHAHQPASIVFSDDLRPDSLKGFKAVLLVDQQVEMESELAAALNVAKAAGITIFTDGTCTPAVVKDFTPLGISFDKLENDPALAGDDGAWYRVPQYFRANLPVLSKALGSVSPLQAGIGEPEVLCSERRSGEARYLFLVNNATTDIDPAFMLRVSLYMANRIPLAIPIAIPQIEGKVVYDVFAFKQVAPRDGTVMADLRSIPARIFAVLPVAIDHVELAGPGPCVAGQTIAWSVRIQDKSGKDIAASIPIRVRLVAGDGSVLCASLASAGTTGASGNLVVPVNPPAGKLILEAFELISGKGARQELTVAAATLPRKTTEAAEPVKPTVKGTPVAFDARAGGLRPSEEYFGPHLRDLVIAENGKLAVMNAFNWDENIYGVDVDSGAVRFRRRLGHYFSFEPQALQKGFCAQGYDLKSAEGYHLYLCGADGTPDRRFALYGLPKRLPFRFLPGMLMDRINNFAVPKDGAWVATAGDLGLAVFARDGKLLWSQDWWKGQRQTVRLAALGNATLAVIEGAVLTQYEAATGRQVGSLRLAPAGEVVEVRVADDGKVIAVRATTDGGRIFLIREGKTIQTFPTAATEMALSPDGMSVAAANRTQLKVYSAEKGLQWVYNADEHLRCPRFSPDGARLAVSTDLATLLVFGADGAVLLERDMGAICVPAWLPDGDLLLASWMGEVRRLDAKYAEKWRTLLRPETTDMRGKILTGIEPPTTRVTGWGNADATTTALKSNLLSIVPAKIALISAKVPGGPGMTLKWQNDPKIFCDGQTAAPPGPWINWSCMNGFSEGNAYNYIEIDTSPRRLRVTAITLVEDPAHPESWLRDGSLLFWDDAKEIWVKAQDVLSDAATHTHKLAQPVEASRFRIGLPWGVCGNLRLGEIGLHGEDLGSPAVDLGGKAPRGKKPRGQTATPPDEPDVDLLIPKE